MLRVLVITYYWPPAGGAGVQRWLKLCKYLPDHGVIPTVITVDPAKATYPQLDESLRAEVRDDIDVIRTDSFEPLQLYGKLFGKEKVPYGGFANVSNQGLLSKVSRFVRGNFFIPDARKGWNKYAYAAAKKVLAERDIDVVITTGPPHSTHLVGLRLKKELRVKWVADFRDPWTEIYYNDQLLRTQTARRRDALLEKKVLERADGIVANCQSNRDLLARKTAAPAVFGVVENGFDAADFRRFEPVHNGCFDIVYTGTMAASYRPGSFLEAVAKFSETLDVPVHLHLAGILGPEVQKQVEQAGLAARTTFYGYVDHKQVLELLKLADLLLLLFPATNLDRGIPGKLFEYLAARTPILNIGPLDGDAARIIHDCKAGETVARDRDIIVEQLKVLHAEAFEKGLFGESSKVADFSRQQCAKKYGAFLDRI